MPTAPVRGETQVESAVIGTSGKGSTVEQAERSIIGYTIFNDWSHGTCGWRPTAHRTGQGKDGDSPWALSWVLDRLELLPGREAKLCGDRLGQRHRDRIRSTAQMDWSSAKSSPMHSPGDADPG